MPSKKSTVRPWPFRNHSNCFWKIEKPVLTSWRIAFNLDLVVTVSHPQELNFTECVPWSTVAIMWPCRKTFEQFVDSLYSTAVLESDQLPLLEIAKFICCSIFLIRVESCKVCNVGFCPPLLNNTKWKTPLGGFVVIRYISIWRTARSQARS